MLVLAVVIGLLVPVGIAQALDEGSGSIPGVVTDGAGKLVAHGWGHIALTGSGWAKLRMHGDVTITVGDDTTVNIRPFGTASADETTGGTTIELQDFAGVIVVRGSHFHISARGRFRSIKAAGNGVAFLQGRGWYRAGGYFGTWTRPGVTVGFSL